ncbi:MAG: hypothetical protein JWP96_942 [Polaromonas sp.]|nr:hypothetical protein [Polaromonas sp.]
MRQLCQKIDQPLPGHAKNPYMALGMCLMRQAIPAQIN